MKLKLKLLLVALMVACLAPAAFADMHAMWSTGVAPGGRILPGAEATRPDRANIDGVGGVLVICDDFNAITYLRSGSDKFEWSVTSTQVSKLASDEVKFFKGSINADVQRQAYAHVAYLAQLLVAEEMSNPTGQVNAARLNYAIWDIFAPGAIATPGLPVQFVAKAYRKEALVAHENGAGGLAYPNVTIWIPTGVQARMGNVPQEFITVRVPESSAVAMILFDLLAVGGLLFFVRRRKAATLS